MNDSLLKELFLGDYDPTPERSEVQQKLSCQLLELYDRIRDTNGLEFAERLSALEGERAEEESFLYYREGFRLGSRLMLEVLMPSGK